MRKLASVQYRKNNQTESLDFTLEPPAGESKRRMVSINLNGRRSYLWIGCDDEATNDMRCFGTLSGVAKLRRLAWAILQEVGEGPAPL